MAIFFNLPDEKSDSIFQENEAVDLKVAMVFAKRFCENIEQLSLQERALIPHALSCIQHKNSCFYIDINDSNVEKEENKLSPLESQNDENWRATTQRLTFLTVQLFYALSVGRLPAKELKFLPSKILCNLSESNMLLIKEFLTHGLSSNIADRYQSFDELSTAIDIIIKRLATQNTSRIVNTTQTRYRNNYKVKLELSNFQATEKSSVELKTPCLIKIGRKIRSSQNEEMLLQTTLGTFYKIIRREDNIPEYHIIIEDNCISRTHTEVIVYKDPKKSTIRDVGSTHGTIVFSSNSCEPETSLLLQNDSICFMNPLEQNFQVGNTLVSITAQIVKL